MNAIPTTCFAEPVFEEPVRVDVRTLDVSIPWPTWAALAVSLLFLIVVVITFFGRSRARRDG